MACITKKRGRPVIDFCDPHGRRRMKTLPVEVTKTEAKRVMRAIETQVERGTFLSARHMPLFPEVAEGWLGYKKAHIRCELSY